MTSIDQTEPAGRTAESLGVLRARWSFLPLVLVVVALVGSVAVPARQTWRVLRLLRETADAIEPARLAEARLELALTREAAALEDYALSRDAKLLEQYRDAARDDEQQLALLETVAPKLDTNAVVSVRLVTQRHAEWRKASRILLERQLPRAQLDSAVKVQQTSYDAMLGAVSGLSSLLAAQSADRRDWIHDAERLGLLVNAALVIVALAALFSVLGLSRRERRLAIALRRRGMRESRLREAAELLASAFAVDDVLRQVAESALPATGARGAVVEAVDSTAGQAVPTLVARAASGLGAPAIGRRIPYGGSLAESVLERGAPLLLPDLVDVDRPSTIDASLAPKASVFAAPLGGVGPTGAALFLLGHPGRSALPAKLGGVATFAHLAALAYEKARLLEEAQRRRLELERVISSRSRLMRGFSHDIKNPLTAADGYASLIEDGVYGTLTQGQTESLGRIRACIHSAFALIDHLHELARTETGKIALTVTTVDLVELARALVEEYRASAETRGLSIEFDPKSDPLVTECDKTRVAQILSNLLSNAIKYTTRGSITIRTRAEASEPIVSPGRWACVDVIDTGCGIPADKRESIFDEFTRLGNKETSGAGLGLAISQRLAELLDGKIAVASEVGTGSTFTLRLPFRKSEMTVPLD